MQNTRDKGRDKVVTEGAGVKITIALASKKRRLVKGGFYIGLLVASIPKKTFELFEKGLDEFWKGMLRL